ncbi:MAG: MFS transporter, partial [Rhizonema sp. PD38]|nr:MFS transporter [Rhizonema sp. PD38]
MELKKHRFARTETPRLLQWVNLRPEESDRTWLMFIFYTIICVGLRWSEDSAVALFLDEYGAQSLPWIYIASAAISTLLVSLYSWLQRTFPLRWVIVAIAPGMFLPLILLQWGIQVPHLAVITVFLLRLWVDAFYVINDLNTSITANQLFNIREIKRTYPLISSGILVADIVSGFSLPLLLLFVGLNNVIMPFAGVFIALGAFILWHFTHKYQQVFPNVTQQKITEPRNPRSHLSGSLKQYTLLLFAFFALLQVLWVLIDFQYLTQLKINYNDKQIASFLGLFGGITGVCELGMQLFISSRTLERFGVFITVASLPVCILILIPLTIPLLEAHEFFWALVILKFLSELLHYTFVASSGPLLFQPIPDKIRNYIQTLSEGIAEAFGGGTAGVIILSTIWLTTSMASLLLQKFVIVVETAGLALICVGIVWLLRSHYVNLLVLSAGQGQLNPTDIDLRAFKQAVVKALGEKSTPADKRSCIELLFQIDPKGAAAVLAPLLVKLPPSLQKTSLEVMLACGAYPAYLPEVNAVFESQLSTQSPEVFALALCYIWLSEANPDLSQLEEYLSRQNSLIRATAATLLLSKGTPLQKGAATKTLRRMLTHKQEQERINAVKALSQAVYLQTLRIYIPNLLQDESLRVRCAVLEMIAATHLEEYYPVLVGGLDYKSTRMTAMRALARLENDALPMLTKLVSNIYKPEVVRIYALATIGKIPTLEAVDTLWLHLKTSRGTIRDRILRTLLKRHEREGITGLVVGLHSKVEILIEQELRFLGEIYAAYIDFKTGNEKEPQSNERFHIICELLQRALLELEIDIKERLLLLLKLLYPTDKIQVAAFNLRSQSEINLARGLEILEHTVNLPSKSVLLNILDRRSPQEKLQKLVEKNMVEYEQMAVGDRTRKLLAQGDLLSDWSFACCFHFA